MAKKKSSTGLNMTDLDDVFSTLSKKTTIIVEESEKEKTFIDTGNYVMNALLSKNIRKGGVADNRITIFAGPPGCGKSYICYNIARNAQKDGYNIIFIDTEYAVEREEMERYGINTDESRFRILRNNMVEEIKIGLSQILESLKQKKQEGLEIGKWLIVLDSIGQLASNKEIEDAHDGKIKVDMSRAKGLKSLFRVITSDMGYLGIPMVATNHIYMCMPEGNKVQMSNGEIIDISDIIKGDVVKTLDGSKVVEDVFEYQNSEVFEIELENGDKISCTPNHKFLVKKEWKSDENANCWKAAIDLEDDDIILAYDEVSKILNENYEKEKKQYVD
jgi:adenylate kinase family enzyme